MNFIDIASHQTGINLEKMFSKNPLDGVIVKATGGTSYKNPEFDGWARWLYENRKFMGAYHYCRELTGNAGTPEAEARHFYNAVKPYIGNIVLAADFEADNSDAFQKGTAWLKEFLDALSDLSGVRPLVYCSQSVTQMFNFNEIVRSGYQLWMAQYATMNPVYGFQDKPWHGGSISPFVGYVIQQYTSMGYLEGWNNNLDFDKFFGGAEDWKALCSCGSEPPKDEPVVEPDVPEVPVERKKVNAKIIMDVLNGDYGVRSTRVKKLKAAGYDPDEVQRKINELYSAAAKIQPTIKANKAYLEPLLKIVDTM